MWEVLAELGDRASPVVDWVIDHWYYFIGGIGAIFIIWYLSKILAMFGIFK